MAVFSVLTELHVWDSHAVETLNYGVHVRILKLVDERQLQGHAHTRARLVNWAITKGGREECRNKKEEVEEQPHAYIIHHFRYFYIII